MKQNYQIDMLYEARLVNLSLPRSALGTLLAPAFLWQDWKLLKILHSSSHQELIPKF